MYPLQRYVSKELTHFVGRQLPAERQYSLLVEILRSRWLTHPPHNRNISGNLTVNTEARMSENQMYVAEVVCFCDIPVSDLDIHIVKYSPFGLSFLKSFLIEKGANPVFYVAKNSTVRVPRQSSDVSELKDAHERSLVIGAEAFFRTVPSSDYHDKMVREYHELSRLLENLVMQHRQSPGVPPDFVRLQILWRFLDFHIFSFTKFFDDAKPDDDPQNFYMEREWRILGNLDFRLDDVQRVILPESYAKLFRQDVPDYAGQVTFVG